MSRLDEIQRGTPGAGNAAARAGLQILSAGWWLAERAKGLAYDWGLRRPTRVERPVISVGNLVAGGTGKTPFVHWLAAGLAARGRPPGLLARGYGRAPDEPLNDEGRVLAHLLGDAVPQVQTADRIAGARALLSAHPEVAVLVLDDGFQHRRLARDLDVVLVDATRPFGYGHRLPRGLLREGPAALGRASAVVITRADQVDGWDLREVRRQVKRHTTAPLFLGALAPVSLTTAAGPLGLDALRDTPVFACAGLGNPENFVRTLGCVGALVVGRRDLPDHGRQDARAWAETVRDARALGAQWVVTTRKDAVKLPTLPDGVAVLDVAFRLAGDPERFWRLVSACGRDQ